MYTIPVSRSLSPFNHIMIENVSIRIAFNYSFRFNCQCVPHVVCNAWWLYHDFLLYTRMQKNVQSWSSRKLQERYTLLMSCLYEQRMIHNRMRRHYSQIAILTKLSTFDKLLVIYIFKRNDRRLSSHKSPILSCCIIIISHYIIKYHIVSFYYIIIPCLCNIDILPLSIAWLNYPTDCLEIKGQNFS